MKVCFLGLGSMGSGVCRNLLNKGYALQVWNRSPEKAAKVAGWGAEVFATPQEAARGAGVVLSCLSSVAALKAVAGGANGVLSCMGKGMAFYDMGTWDIESVLALEAEAERHGVRYVYMPMGKGPEAAEAGESPLFFGGSRVINGMKSSGEKRDNLGSIGKDFRWECNSIAESATKKEGNQPSFFVV